MHACTCIITVVHIHTLLHAWTCLYVHTPILQVCFLQLGRETLAIFPRSAAGVRVVFLKIFQEFQGSEIVVKIDVVILSLQI